MGNGVTFPSVKKNKTKGGWAINKMNCKMMMNYISSWPEVKLDQDLRLSDLVVIDDDRSWGYLKSNFQANRDNYSI